MIEGSVIDSDTGAFKLLVIVVLYKLRPCESAAFKTLQAATLYCRNRNAAIKILLYDNTPGGQDVGALPADVMFKADIQNRGLATAYNYALDVAQEGEFDWLLTLDQDTSLPEDFLCRLYDAAMFAAPLSNIGAIVPCLLSDGRKISPFTLLKPWALSQRLPDQFIGACFEETVAANSGSTFRVAALRAVGGYDPRFYVWCSDAVIFHRLYLGNFRVFVIGNVHVEHELAGFDLRTRSNPERFASAFQAEEAYYDECLGGVARIVLLLKIGYRMIYGIWRVGGDIAYLRICARFLCRRLFLSRRHRLKTWQRFVQQRSIV